MDSGSQYLTKRQIEQTMESVLQAPHGIIPFPLTGSAIPQGMVMQMDQGGAPPKRYKMEEVLGDQNGLKIATRIVMNRSDMSKVIGKGGANIALIRTNCGAFVKGGFLRTTYVPMNSTGGYPTPHPHNVCMYVSTQASTSTANHASSS